MRFEQLLNIYWKKKIYISTEVIEFNETFNSLFLIFGINNKLKNFFIKKFKFHKLLNTNLIKIEELTEINIRFINIIFSKFYCVNYNILEYYIWNTLKLFWIKSYKGICCIINKPVKSQRTHSNRKTKSFLSFLVKKKYSQLLNSNKKKTFSNKNTFVNVLKKEKYVKKKHPKKNLFNEFVKLKSWI